MYRSFLWRMVVCAGVTFLVTSNSFVAPAKAMAEDAVNQHSVDALTGADGCSAPAYLDTHWEYADHLEVHDVDVDAIDPGIEDGP